MSMNNNDNFYVADFLIFTGTLLISTFVGIFFAYKDRGKQSTENYYFGGRHMSPVPVAASLSVSYVSAITVIGLPVEVYLFGTVFAWDIVGQLMSTAVAVLFYIPVFHGLKLKSVYEYLELRFNRVVRIFASTIGMLNLFLYMGIAIYIPSLALTSVTPLDLKWAIGLTSVICTFYTTIGGMKAVVWTDVIQAVIMIAGMLGVFIQAVAIVGGFSAIAAASQRGERNNFFKFDIDPRVRSTAWTVGIGLGLNTCFKTGCNQVYIQRYLSCRTVKAAQMALLLTLIPGFIFILLTVGNGLAMYTYYEGCDPFLSGKIDKADQSMPRLAVEIFQNIPGMAGLFVSTAYCGTFSTISSGINSLAGLALEDFIIPRFPAMSSTNRVVTSKILSAIFGSLVMLLAYVVSLTTSNIFQVVTSISGFVGGPMIGIFTMGLFMPWTNNKGALSGIVCGWAFVGWIGISAMFGTGLHVETTKKLPLSIESCNSSIPYFGASDQLPSNNFTSSVSLTSAIPSITTSNTSQPLENLTLQNTLYSISPFYYGLLGCLVCVTIGNMVSIVTGKSSNVDPDLFASIIKKKMLRTRKTVQEKPNDGNA